MSDVLDTSLLLHRDRCNWDRSWGSNHWRIAFFFWFDDSNHVRQRVLRANLSCRVMGQHDRNLNSEDTLPELDMAVCRMRIATVQDSRKKKKTHIWSDSCAAIASIRRKENAEMTPRGITASNGTGTRTCGVNVFLDGMSRRDHVPIAKLHSLRTLCTQLA